MTTDYNEYLRKQNSADVHELSLWLRDDNMLTMSNLEVDTIKTEWHTGLLECCCVELLHYDDLCEACQESIAVCKAADAILCARKEY